MAFAAFGSSAPAREPSPLRKGRLALILIAPGVLYLLLFFLTPFISLVVTSLQVADPYSIRGTTPGFRIENYGEAFGAYWEWGLRAFIYAIAATVFALLISYPIAYFIGVTARKWPMLQAVALVLVIAPFFISFLLRTLAWRAFLGEPGLSGFLHSTGIMPVSESLLGTDFSVILGLTYNFIPFMTLPLYASLERLDLRYVEAGNDLYAKPSTTFWKVTFPLSLPGVVSGTLLTFIPAAGEFVTAEKSYLGGQGTAMVGNAIQNEFLLPNLPVATALSVMLMIVVVAIIAIYVKRAGTDELL